MLYKVKPPSGGAGSQRFSLSLLHGVSIVQGV